MCIRDRQKNGCCYCLVDDSGERTFICEHGAEYFYQASWFDQLDANNYQQVYVCGLEIEEEMCIRDSFYTVFDISLF